MLWSTQGPHLEVLSSSELLASWFPAGPPPLHWLSLWLKPPCLSCPKLAGFCMCSSKLVAVALYQNLTFCPALASFPNLMLFPLNKLVFLHDSKLMDAPHPGVGRSALWLLSEADLIHPIPQPYNCKLHPGLQSHLQGRSPQPSQILNTLLLTHTNLPLGNSVLGSLVLCSIARWIPVYWTADSSQDQVYGRSSGQLRFVFTLLEMGTDLRLTFLHVHKDCLMDFYLFTTP